MAVQVLRSNITLELQNWSNKWSNNRWSNVVKFCPRMKLDYPTMSLHTVSPMMDSERITRAPPVLHCACKAARYRVHAAGVLRAALWRTLDCDASGHNRPAAAPPTCCLFSYVIDAPSTRAEGKVVLNVIVTHIRSRNTCNVKAVLCPPRYAW